jgi:succinate dehydrogenase/fumarate reductase flavoprotein subunit
MVPLDSPPFYCVPLYPGGSNTSGGPRRDGRARVLGVGGEPIPGLFCAGELGSPIALLYPADGSNLSEAFCFGQIAAETALEEMETGEDG